MRAVLRHSLPGERREASMVKLLSAIAVAAFLAMAPVAGHAQQCCANNGGVSGACSPESFVVCADGTVSATCRCGSGIGTDPGSLGELVMPGPAEFGNITLGATTSPTLVKITNSGALTVTVTEVRSSAPQEFIIGNGCLKVAGGGSCTISVTFKPAAAGARSGAIGIASTGVGGPKSFAVSGTGVPPGGPPPPPGTRTIEVVEYQHDDWGYYFVTGGLDEISQLDAGTYAGWRRTGPEFRAYPTGTAGTTPVCRFFSTAFAPRSSHFYTPHASECAAVKGNPNWSFEGEVFGLVASSPTGACPNNFVPLFRLYNNGEGGAPNHRYTTDSSLRSVMLAFGWIPEGNGDLGVTACVPR